MKEQAKVLTEKTIEFDRHDSNYRIEWRTAFRWKNISGYGDVPSVVTQCLVFVNGFMIGNAHVSKHSKDENNLEYAMKISVAKALETSETASYWFYDECKAHFWKLFFEKNKTIIKHK